MFPLFWATLMQKGFLTDNTCLHSQCWGMCLWDLILFSFRNNLHFSCLTCLPVWLMHSPCKVLCTLQSSVLPHCSWLLIKGAHRFSLLLVLWLYCFSLVFFLLLQHFSSLFLLSSFVNVHRACFFLPFCIF